MPSLLPTLPLKPPTLPPPTLPLPPPLRCLLQSNLLLPYRLECRVVSWPCHRAFLASLHQASRLRYLQPLRQNPRREPTLRSSPLLRRVRTRRRLKLLMMTTTTTTTPMTPHLHRPIPTHCHWIDLEDPPSRVLPTIRQPSRSLRVPTLCGESLVRRGSSYSPRLPAPLHPPLKPIRVLVESLRISSPLQFGYPHADQYQAYQHSILHRRHLHKPRTRAYRPPPARQSLGPGGHRASSYRGVA